MLSHGTIALKIQVLPSFLYPLWNICKTTPWYQQFKSSMGSQSISRSQPTGECMPWGSRNMPDHHPPINKLRPWSDSFPGFCAIEDTRVCNNPVHSKESLSSRFTWSTLTWISTNAPSYNTRISSINAAPSITYNPSIRVRVVQPKKHQDAKY